MPDRKCMVGNQSQAGDGHKAGADPQQMGGAPKHLSHGLRMAADPHDARGVQTHLGFQHRWNLEQVVGGGVEEKEAHRRACPHQGDQPRLILEIPQADSVIPVAKEVSNQQGCRRNAHCSKEKPPSPFPDPPSPPCPHGGSPAVQHSEAQQQRGHHPTAVMRGGAHGVPVVKQ